MLSFSIKLEKPHSWPTFGSSVQKLPKQVFCQNNFVQFSTFMLLYPYAKKSEKFNASICYKMQKTYFQLLLVQKSQ